MSAGLTWNARRSSPGRGAGTPDPLMQTSFASNSKAGSSRADATRDPAVSPILEAMRRLDPHGNSPNNPQPSLVKQLYALGI